MYPLEEYESIIDERHSEVFYNGGFEEDEDPMDYVSVKGVVNND